MHGDVMAEEGGVRRARWGVGTSTSCKCCLPKYVSTGEGAYSTYHQWIGQLRGLDLREVVQKK
jgi:hypothetical protein